VRGGGARERGEAIGEAPTSGASPLCCFVGDGEGVVEMGLADGSVGRRRGWRDLGSRNDDTRESPGGGCHW